MSDYRVEPNSCNCHPETCCCPDFVLFHGDYIVARGSNRTELQKLVTYAKDASRWHAFIRSTGHEVDMSTGPGSSKDMHIRIDCTGCEKYLESGAPDYEGTLNAVMDDETRLQAITPAQRTNEQSL